MSQNARELPAGGAFWLQDQSQRDGRF